MKKKVFILEDEPAILELLKLHLSDAGMEVFGFSNASSFFSALEEETPDLILLDLMLPDMGGLEVCHRIKTNEKLWHIPIIMVTAKGTESDIVRGLEQGADDYITKPFSSEILKARTKAVLNRGRRVTESPSGEKLTSRKDVLHQGHISLHKGRHEVTVDGQPIQLTGSEFEILNFLMAHPGWVYTRGQIVDAIRGVNYAVTERAIDFQMVGLRKKLAPHSHVIETVRGVGYRFKENL